MLEKHKKYFDILKLSKLETPTIDEIDRAYKEFIESIRDFENAENAAAITQASEACTELKNWLVWENKSSKCEYQQTPEMSEPESITNSFICQPQDNFFEEISFPPSLQESAYVFVKNDVSENEEMLVGGSIIRENQPTSANDETSTLELCAAKLDEMHVEDSKSRSESIEILPMPSEEANSEHVNQFMVNSFVNFVANLNAQEAASREDPTKEETLQEPFNHTFLHQTEQQMTFEMEESPMSASTPSNERLFSDTEHLPKPLERIDQTQVDSTTIPSIERSVFLFLEEILSGCTKLVTINRRVIDPSVEKENTLSLEIVPGIEVGSKITFKGEGHQMGDNTFGDVICVIKEMSHHLFKRINQVDIEYSISVLLLPSLEEYEFQIPTLEKETISLSLTKDELKVEAVRQISGRGLPYPDGRRGDLLVRIKVEEEPFENAQIEPKTKEIVEQIKEKLPANECSLNLTLENIYHGCVRVEDIQRTIIGEDGIEHFEVASLIIEVPPGSIDGTILTLKEEGDRAFGKESADVIFTVSEEVHPIYKRIGHDIEYTVHITPNQAILGIDKLPVPIDLGMGTMMHSVKGKILPGSVERLPNLGVPQAGNANKRGDLLLRFEIVMEEAPKSATDEIPDEGKLKDDDIIQDFPMTLENVLHGLSKRMQITRSIFDENGDEVNSEIKVVQIIIQPGTVDRTEVRFEGLGDVYPDSLPADVVFILREVPHLYLKRQGVNLMYSLQVTASEIAAKREIEIPSLDDCPLTLKLDKVNLQLHRNEMSFQGRGLPSVNDPTSRGALLVKCEIVNENRKDAPIRHSLAVSLDEILHGCTKKRKILRMILDGKGKEAEVEKIVTITVKPGAETGEEYCFPRYGNQRPGAIPGDLVFVLEEKHHPLFKRNQANLEISKRITKIEALRGHFDFPTLEGSSATLAWSDVTKTNNIRKIKNHGLPYPFNSKLRGDIVVKFSIVKNRTCKVEKSKEEKGKETISTNDSQKENVPQVPPININLELTLEELFRGYTAVMQFPCTEMDESGNVRQVKKSFPITIPPGEVNGRQFIFEKEGNKFPNQEPADIVYVVRELAHSVFCRQGLNIEYTARVTAEEFVIGSRIDIPTLEKDRKTYVTVMDLEETVIHIKGLGFPHREKTEIRGNLIVKIQIIT